MIMLHERALLIVNPTRLSLSRHFLVLCFFCPFNRAELSHFFFALLSTLVARFLSLSLIPPFTLIGTLKTLFLHTLFFFFEVELHRSTVSRGVILAFFISESLLKNFQGRSHSRNNKKHTKKEASSDLNVYIKCARRRRRLSIQTGLCEASLDRSFLLCLRAYVRAFSIVEFSSGLAHTQRVLWDAFFARIMYL